MHPVLAGIFLKAKKIISGYFAKNFVSDFDADHNEIIERIRFLKGKQN